jgi:hypothetical protein
MTCAQVCTSHLAVLLLLIPSLATAGDKPTVVTANPFETDFPSGGSFRMDLCSSGVDLRGTDDNKLRVSYDSKNGYDAGRVKVKIKTSGNAGTLEIDGCPHNNFQITINVPKVTDLYVRIWAGQLDVSNITGDKDLELHAGQLDVSIGKPEEYGQVDASVMTGEVDAAPFDVSKGGLFRSFHKTGPGKYRLHAHVGAGQVDLN